MVEQRSTNARHLHGDGTNRSWTCTTTQIDLTATGGTSYLWSNSDATAATSITTPGTYTVR
ncbi:MAG: hypothetical protein R2830_08125 [Saprospiraceae bacterium]